MHAVFRVGDTPIMISDGMNNGSPKFDGFALSINAKDVAEAQKYFNALLEGGEVTMPLDRDVLRQDVRHGEGQVRRALDGRRAE